MKQRIPDSLVFAYVSAWRELQSVTLRREDGEKETNNLAVLERNLIEDVHLLEGVLVRMQATGQDLEDWRASVSACRRPS